MEKEKYRSHYTLPSSPSGGLVPLAWLHVPLHAIHGDPEHVVGGAAVLDQRAPEHKHHVAELGEGVALAQPAPKCEEEWGGGSRKCETSP